MCLISFVYPMIELKFSIRDIQNLFEVFTRIEHLIGSKKLLSTIDEPLSFGLVVRKWTNDRDTRIVGAMKLLSVAKRFMFIEVENLFSVNSGEKASIKINSGSKALNWVDVLVYWLRTSVQVWSFGQPDLFL